MNEDNQEKSVEKRPKPASGVSITGLVTGICSLVLFWVPGVHFILMVLGIVFSGIAISRKERFGLAGLLTSLSGLALVVMIWGYFFWFAAAVAAV